MGKETTIRWMESRYDSKCGGCGDQIQQGDRIAYDFKEKAAFCQTCGHEEEELQLSKEQTAVKTELEDLEASFD